jgi:hypothetical protein
VANRYRDEFVVAGIERKSKAGCRTLYRDYILEFTSVPFFAVTGLLVCVIVAWSKDAKDFSVWEPSKALAKSGAPSLTKNIFICDNAPDVQAFTFADLDVFNLRVFRKIIYDCAQGGSLLRSKHGSSDDFIGEGEGEIFRQWNGQDFSLGSVADFIGGGVPTINKQWLALKFQGLVSLLINRSPNGNSEIRSHLLSRAFFEGGDAIRGCFGAYGYFFRDNFHRGSQTSSFSNRALHSLGLFGGRFDGLSQLARLVSKNKQLEQTHNSQNKRSNNQPSTESNQLPFIRRFFFAVFGLLSGFYISLRGWHLLDNQRKLPGAPLVGIERLVGAAGLGLLWLTGFPQT